MNKISEREILFSFGKTICFFSSLVKSRDESSAENCEICYCHAKPWLMLFIRPILYYYLIFWDNRSFFLLMSFRRSILPLLFERIINVILQKLNKIINWRLIIIIFSNRLLLRIWRLIFVKNLLKIVNVTIIGILCFIEYLGLSIVIFHSNVACSTRPNRQTLIYSLLLILIRFSC